MSICITTTARALRHSLSAADLMRIGKSSRNLGGKKRVDFPQSGSWSVNEKLNSLHQRVSLPMSADRFVIVLRDKWK